MKRQRLVACGIALIVASACGDSEAEDAADGGGSQEPAPLAMEAPPELDLDTLQADTPAGTVDAERLWDDAYVGAVTEDLYIAVSLSEGSDASEPGEVTVYLCDSETGEHLSGELGSETTTLQGEMLEVELALADGVVSGAVTLDDGESVSFEANPASGVAGLYGAEFTFEGYEYRPRWIVLPDGSQRGQACWRCCGRICTICCCTTTSCIRQF